ncbi:Uncharacterised protein [Neisseria gonorrhoeae]|uniref:Uncharacterized protein n=1 Tax=Neisseria gonorrhoeae TaxID=485 RepID=A0A379B0W7_NEIGO|nr:Uncharacterised protein [Neisseria gonorrhoeae]
MATFVAAAVAAAFSGLTFGFGRCGICNGCGRLYVAALDFRFVGAFGGTVAAFVAAAVAVVARFGFVGARFLSGSFARRFADFYLLPSRLLRRGFWRRLLARLPLRFAVLRFSEVSAAGTAWVSLPPKMRLSHALKLSHQEVFSRGGSRAGLVWRTPLTAGSGGRFWLFAAERFGGFVFFRLGNALVARFAVFFYVVGADAVDFVVRISRWMFGIRTTFTSKRSSIANSSARFSFSRKVATSTGTWARTSPVLSFIASS